MQKKCDFCGKVFTTHSNRPQMEKYCCLKCKQEQEKTRTNRHINRCANCGGEIRRYDKPKGKLVFCCRKCQGEYNHRQAYEYRKCEFCGKEYECSKKSKQRFCCATCQNKWQSTLKGSQCGNYHKHVTIANRTVVCQVCGKSFLTRPYCIKTAKYCSHECAHFALVQAHTRKDSREKRVDTVIQRKVNGILESLGIEYVNEKQVGYFRLDNFLTASRLVIEVMGQYWHADIRIFQNHINDIQKRDIIQDKKKRTFVLNKLGVHILYLWEEEVLHNEELCRQLVLRYVNSDGKLLDYHSYNYHLDNGECMLNHDLIVGYMDRNNNYSQLTSSETLND